MNPRRIAAGGWLALALWLIMVWGDPDLLDALIAALMESCP